MIEIIDMLDVNWDQPNFAAGKIKIIESGVDGKALAFIIGEEVADTIPLTEWFADLLLSVDCFTDGGNNEQDYYVNLIKNNSVINILKCNEMQHAILLSEPLILDYINYENSIMVCPGWSFIDNKFVIPGEV